MLADRAICSACVNYFIFTARRLRYASAIYALGVSVCRSQTGIVSKQLNVGSRKQRHVIAQGL